MKTELILILFAGIMSISMTAFAQVDEVDVGFEWTDKTCQDLVFISDAGSYKILTCDWRIEIIGEEPPLTEKDTTTLTPDEKVIVGDTEIDETVDETDRLVPPLRTEQQIKVEGIIQAREVVEAYGSGDLDVDLFCFGGKIKENTIYYPDTDTTINIKTPNDNVPLKTNLQFKYEHLMSEICKAEYTLANKVHNAGRTQPGEGEQIMFVPRSDFEGLIWDELEGLENPQYAYDEAKMTAFNFESNIQFATEFQCSITGKQQGLCVLADFENLEPEPTISKEGKKALDAYWLLRETGEAELPFQEPDVQPTQESNTRQYLAALGWTEEQIDAMIEAGENKETDEDTENENN